MQTQSTPSSVLAIAARRGISPETVNLFAGIQQSTAFSLSAAMQAFAPITSRQDVQLHDQNNYRSSHAGTSAGIHV